MAEITKDTRELIELRLWLLRHCQSLQAMVCLWETQGVEAAMARLDQIVEDATRVVRAQAAEKKFTCPACDEPAPVLRWVASEGMCPNCFETFDPLA